MKMEKNPKNDDFLRFFPSAQRCAASKDRSGIARVLACSRSPECAGREAAEAGAILLLYCKCIKQNCGIAVKRRRAREKF